LSRYETAFQILHNLRVGIVRPDQDRIGGKPGEHVEADETWVDGRTRGEGRGVHHKTLVAAAVEVQQRKPGTNLKTWLRDIHHGVSPQHLQAYLNEFTFRFNRRFYPFNAFRSLLGIAGDVTALTYAELYAANSRPTTSSRSGSQPDKHGINYDPRDEIVFYS
jgi:hypothetical protein